MLIHIFIIHVILKLYTLSKKVGEPSLTITRKLDWAFFDFEIWNNLRY
jgi:hypothetical protein